MKYVEKRRMLPKIFITKMKSKIFFLGLSTVKYTSKQVSSTPLQFSLEIDFGVEMVTMTYGFTMSINALAAMQGFTTTVAFIRKCNTFKFVSPT